MTSTGAGLRWGILGAARIARALIPAIRAAGGEVTFLGVREPNSERARAFAAEWNIPAVGSYAEAIASDVDAIYNPLPNDLHLPLTRDTLRAGKHALTEKPFTLNAAEAAELEREAQAAGRVLLEAFAYRFQPHVERIVELVRGGELGEIRSYRGAFGFPLTNPDDFRWEASKGGGALFDVGTYTVNLMRLLLGEPAGRERPRPLDRRRGRVGCRCGPERRAGLPAGSGKHRLRLRLGRYGHPAAHRDRHAGHVGDVGGIPQQHRSSRYVHHHQCRRVTAGNLWAVQCLRGHGRPFPAGGIGAGSGPLSAQRRCGPCPRAGRPLRLGPHGRKGGDRGFLS